MKKVIFALVALMVALPMVAQDYKIASDDAKPDGSRSISCELVTTRSFSDKQVFNVGLSSITIDVEGGAKYKKIPRLKSRHFGSAQNPKRRCVAC